MDTSTGEVFTPKEVKKVIKQKPKRAKFMRKIPDNYLKHMQGMNRADRRQFYREHKKEFDSLQ